MKAANTFVLYSLFLLWVLLDCAQNAAQASFLKRRNQRPVFDLGTQLPVLPNKGNEDNKRDEDKKKKKKKRERTPDPRRHVHHDSEKMVGSQRSHDSHKRHRSDTKQKKDEKKKLRKLLDELDKNAVTAFGKNDSAPSSPPQDNTKTSKPHLRLGHDDSHEVRREDVLLGDKAWRSIREIQLGAVSEEGKKHH